jgi:hypothetical protein
MKIPSRILDLARGPLLATAALACSSSGPAPDPAPMQAQRIVPEPPDDLVSYDAAGEAERLARTDTLLADDEARRSQRISDEEEARRERLMREMLQARRDHLMRRCGRG